MVVHVHEHVHVLCVVCYVCMCEPLKEIMLFHEPLTKHRLLGWCCDKVLLSWLICRSQMETRVYLFIFFLVGGV